MISIRHKMLLRSKEKLSQRAEPLEVTAHYVLHNCHHLPRMARRPRSPSYSVTGAVETEEGTGGNDAPSSKVYDVSLHRALLI